MLRLEIPVAAHLKQTGILTGVDGRLRDENALDNCR